MNKLVASAAVISALTTGIFASAQAKASKGNLDSTPDFLLILGCRVRGDEPEETLKTRIEAAAQYLLKNESVIAVCCGGIVHADQTKSEAQAIKEGLLAAGVEESRILLEDKSQTTEENFINAKRIIESAKDKTQPTVAFLSSEFHLLRASFIAKKAGLSCGSVAAPSPKNTLLKNYIREFFVFPAAFLS